jgi:hypothetical protein
MFGFVLALVILSSILEGNIQQASALLALGSPTLEAIVRLFTNPALKQEQKLTAPLSPRERRRARRQRTTSGEKRRWRKGLRLPR